MSVVFDTNIFIYINNGKLPYELVDGLDIAYASVTRIEALGYHKITAEQIHALTMSMASCTEIPLSTPIIDHAIALRQSRGKRMSLPDAIIAATALEADAELWTANTEDFAGIDGLKLINPLVTT